MTDDALAARQQRANERRRLWQGHKTTLERLPEVEVLRGTPGELMALVTELTRMAWALRGEPIPDYPRSSMPGRVIRPRDARDDPRRL